MAQDPWAGFEEVGASAPPIAPVNQRPGYIPGVPKAPPQSNPRDIYEDERDYSRSTQNDLVNNEQSLRKEFYGLPAVKEFQVAGRTYANSLQAADDASGDQSLIVAYAKMLDPGSVVREGEAAAVAGADSTIGRTIARVAKEFGFQDGGQLSPQIRAKIRREMRTLAENYGKAYDLERGQFEGLASSYGFDPSRVVGQHLLDPYRETIDGYWNRVGDAPQPVNNPTNASTYANGVQFGMDGDGDAPFDRNRYLQETYGITPEKEDRIAGMWNANLRNPNLSVDSVKQWYAQEGVPPPADNAIAATIEEAKRGVPFSGLDTVQAEKQYTQGLDTVLAGRGADPESLSGAVGVNAMQGIMLQGGDEVAGAGGFINAALSGQNPIAGYEAERDLIRREQQRASEARPMASAVSNIGGSLLTGGAGFGTVSRATNLAAQARAAGNMGRAADLGSMAVRASVRPGAAMGATYGFNSGEGATDSLASLAVGGASGAAIAPVVQAGFNRIAPALDNTLAGMTRGPSAEQRATLEAAERMDVPMRQPDLRPELRNQRSVLRTSPNGEPIRNAEVADVEAIENAVGRSLIGGANPSRREIMGENAQEALNNVRQRSGQQIGQMYDRARQLAGNGTYSPTNALAELDNQIAEVAASGEAANRGLLSYLRDIRNDLTQGGPVNTGILDAQGNPLTRPPAGLTIDALRNQRTNMRGQINERNLTRTDAERRVGAVLDAASQDITSALSGNTAAQRIFREADTAWAERHRFVKQIMEKVNGPENQPKSGSAAASTIEGWLKGDFRRARDLWTRLNPDEQADIAATVADNLGRNARGEFSLGEFLKHTSTGRGASLSPQSARLIFGEDGMRAIADLRRITQAKVDAGAQTNFSNTGNVVQRVGRGLRGILFAGLGMGAGGPVGGAGAAVATSWLTTMGERRAVRLLLNPDFTRWMRNAPPTGNPRAIDAYFARLDSLAARSPAMAADIAGFRNAIIGANDNAASSLAAEPGGADDQGQRQ